MIIIILLCHDGVFLFQIPIGQTFPFNKNSINVRVFQVMPGRKERILLSRDAAVSQTVALKLFARFARRVWSSSRIPSFPPKKDGTLRCGDSPLDRQNSPPDCFVCRFAGSLRSRKKVTLVTSALSAADKLPCQSPCDGANPCSLYPPRRRSQALPFKSRQGLKQNPCPSGRGFCFDTDIHDGLESTTSPVRRLLWKILI